MNYVETIEKCRHLKKFTCEDTLRQVFILPSYIFSWGGVAILLVRNLVRYRMSVYTVCIYCTLQVTGATVHKAGSKIPT
jgi:hypothetical protein